jgi:AcrR family transcriptional regulator
VTEPTTIWSRPERQGRGPRPAYSRAQITAAAVAVADADGLDAASMRRVAAEIGTGAMSLYRYVPSRDDLVELMIDHVYGEFGLPKGSSGDWRADLRLGAEHARAALLRHPWAVDARRARPALGPNQLRYLEFMMGALDVGIPVDDIMTYTGLVTSYVQDTVREEAAWAAETRRTGMTADAWMRASGGYVRDLTASGRYPMLTRVVRDARQPHLGREERFAYGLDRVLACIAAMLPDAP